MIIDTPILSTLGTGELTAYIARIAQERVDTARKQAPVYQVVAFDPARKLVYVQRPGSIDRRVSWDDFRCDCPDCHGTLRDIEIECRRRRMFFTRVLCKHVHLLSEVVARALAARGLSVDAFKDELEALPHAFPGLPLTPPVCRASDQTTRRVNSTQEATDAVP